MDLSGKTILITGGGSGIGLALARQLAPANTVVIAGRDEARLASARDAVPSLQVRRLDVTDEQEASATIDWIRSELGGLDVLINSAGTAGDDALTSPGAAASTARDIDINIGGVVRMTRLAMPLLRESEDSAIVFISSGMALAAAPGAPVYAATKAAVHSFARSVRADPANRGIHVCEVIPPMVDTDLRSGLNVPKVPVSTVVDATLDGLADNRTEIRIGRIKWLAVAARVSQRLADFMAAQSLRPR